MELYNIYRPIIATPFKNCENYMEFEPCDALKPYIRCFAGTRRAVKQGKSDVIVKGIVTPDTCMDIIFTVDFTNNKIESTFCGINDRTFATHSASNENKTIFTFVIRFYAWGAVAFAEESMRDTKNAFFDVGYHFGVTLYIIMILIPWMLYTSMGIPTRHIYAMILRNIIP